MKVYVIGAGPGDPKLITVRGAELVASCPVVLYTGSLVPAALVQTARRDALVLDSSGMTLEEIVAVMVHARDAGQDVARVHTGDPSVFGSTAEQLRRLQELGIACEIVPGVSSFAAAAAALGRELTLPELSQTVILTRAEGRTPMPEREKLEELATHRATLCLFLSITLLRDAVAALTPAYGEDCPVAVVHRASWPDQKIVTGTLADIREKVREAKLRSQSMILVGRVLTATDFANSKLYDPSFSHGYRRAAPSEGRRWESTDNPGASPRTPNDASPDPSLRDDARVDEATTGETVPDSERGLLVVYTGDGKGKTTAALGMVFRALGHGLRVSVVQFIKGKWKTGERRFAESLPQLRFEVMGLGFTWESDDLSRDAARARAAWETARAEIQSGERDLVVLDELTYAVHFDFVSLEEIIDVLQRRPPRVHVVVTGRNAPEALLSLADTVTEMTAQKHPFTTGRKAVIGVDF